jgi:hypothetical protein
MTARASRPFAPSQDSEGEGLGDAAQRFARAGGNCDALAPGRHSRG